MNEVRVLLLRKDIGQARSRLLFNIESQFYFTLFGIFRDKEFSDVSNC